jgi:hypothetical protein
LFVSIVPLKPKAGPYVFPICSFVFFIHFVQFVSLSLSLSLSACGLILALTLDLTFPTHVSPNQISPPCPCLYHRLLNTLGCPP